MSRGGRRLVYSTGPEGARSVRGDGCARCGASPCRCAQPQSVSPGEQRVRVRHERRGRRGKTVTVVHPLLLSRDAAQSLLRLLKQRCGSGGTLRSEPARDERAAFALELQGDHVDAIVVELCAAGFDAKREGG